MSAKENCNCIACELVKSEGLTEAEASQLLSELMEAPLESGYDMKDGRVLMAFGDMDFRLLPRSQVIELTSFGEMSKDN